MASDHENKEQQPVTGPTEEKLADKPTEAKAAEKAEPKAAEGKAESKSEGKGEGAPAVTRKRSSPAASAEKPVAAQQEKPAAAAAEFLRNLRRDMEGVLGGKNKSWVKVSANNPNKADCDPE